MNQYRKLCHNRVGLLLIIPILFMISFVLGRRSGIKEAQSHRFEELMTNTAIESKLVELDDQLKSLNSSDEALRLAVGLDPIPEEVFDVGIGGRENPYSVDNSLDITHKRLDVLSRRISVLRQSLSEAEKRAVKNVERLSCIPSISPVPGAIINSRFGMRIHPVYGVEAMHEGIDLAAKEGTPVVASADGIISFCGTYGGYGLMVEIDHGNGISTRYAHNKMNKVRNGQRVTRGQTIGLVGTTGVTTSVHLHYEVRRDGEAIDPIPYVLPGVIVD